MSDDDPRTWWLFEHGEVLTIVPADSEGLARRTLAQNSYAGAPVASYKCRGQRAATRAQIAALLLGVMLIGCTSTLPPEPPITETLSPRTTCEPAACFASLPPPDMCERKP